MSSVFNFSDDSPDLHAAYDQALASLGDYRPRRTDRRGGARIRLGAHGAPSPPRASSRGIPPPQHHLSDLESPNPNPAFVVPNCSFSSPKRVYDSDSEDSSSTEDEDSSPISDSSLDCSSDSINEEKDSLRITTTTSRIIESSSPSPPRVSASSDSDPSAGSCSQCRSIFSDIGVKAATCTNCSKKGRTVRCCNSPQKCLRGSAMCQGCNGWICHGCERKDCDEYSCMNCFAKFCRQCVNELGYLELCDHCCSGAYCSEGCPMRDAAKGKSVCDECFCEYYQTSDQDIIEYDVCCGDITDWSKLKVE